jgi:hypothetical protein
MYIYALTPHRRPQSLNIFVDMPTASSDIFDSTRLDSNDDMAVTLTAIKYHITVMNAPKRT